MTTSQMMMLVRMNTAWREAYLRAMAKVCMVLVASALIGCGEFKPPTPDQCLRREIFRECMSVLPKGPESTMSNDWAEVVGECSRTALSQSLRQPEQIAPECSL